MPVAVILRTWTDDAGVSFLDAKGVEVDYDSAMVFPDWGEPEVEHSEGAVFSDSEEPGVLLVEPEQEGSCGVTVRTLRYSDPLTYTLRVVEAPPGSSALVQIIDGELPAGQKADHSFQAAAGEWFVVAVHPAAGECGYLRFEVLDEAGQPCVDSLYFDAGCDADLQNPAKALYFGSSEGGSYTVRIEDGHGNQVRYRVYILRVE